MMSRNTFVLALSAMLALALPYAARAQTVSEDFTGTTTTNPWYYFNGACLTASSNAGAEPSGNGGGQVPGCTTGTYYTEALVGGYNGVAGGGQTLPDPNGHGALRFTNGSWPGATDVCHHGASSDGKFYCGGYSQKGAIVSTTPFPTGQGISIAFKTVTYRGNSLGGHGMGANDGADGISFYLMDASQLDTTTILSNSGNGNGLGAFGGSLAYSCSNGNFPYNGLIGGYIGLGVDEYGNFLNGAVNTLGETGSSNNGAGLGDNTASGGFYQPGRIGLRGAGNVAWNTLTGAYGATPTSPGGPYYPASLAQSCLNSGGVYNANANTCETCATGVNKGYNSSTNQCVSCPSGITYNPVTNTCDSCPTTVPAQHYDAASQSCQSCPAGTTFDTVTFTCESCSTSGGSYDSSTNTCNSCPAGQTYDTTTQTCQSCSSGSYDSANNTCSSCASGSWDANTGKCETCTGGTWTNSGGAGTCTGTGACSVGSWNGNNDSCQKCAAGYTWNDTFVSGGECYKCASVANTPISGTSAVECCPNGNTWNAVTNKCSGGAAGLAPSGTQATTAGTQYTPSPSSGGAPVVNTPTQGSPDASITSALLAPTTSSPNTAQTDNYYAVKNTCATGHIWNYSTANAPTDAGPAELSNPLNIGNAASGFGPILDYDAIPNAYAVLPTSPQLANESAMSRGAATPIFYNLKITQNGLLSFSYSINGGAYQQVLKGQNIVTNNGALPANFLFGFAGSSGGGTNVHEILCFKAVPATTAASSAGASERQSAKLETGAQAYFAFYNPNGWTGRVTASSLSLDQFGNVVVAPSANWDGQCVLDGIATGATCPTTLANGPVAAQGATNRSILTWNGTAGIPFEYNSLTTAQQGVIDAGDVTTVNCNASTAYDPSDRVNYLRGDTSCHINSLGIGLFRARDTILGDLIDSSPAWVGPPVAPFPATWSDRLYPAAVNSENGGGAQNYVQYTVANETRLNVVYAGANDGLLHGFRSGSYNSNGSFCSTAANCTGTVTPNDGYEVLAYMPGAVLQSIHNTANPGLDFSNSQYGHNFFVDATPGTGDLFYNNAWHSWVVGGLGPGGAAIYALDVTNPTSFAESNAGSLVMGEWTSATISCAGATSANGGANCGNNLGNTYGTPSIRRLHNGDWAVIFGNGLGSTSGDAGIYILTVDPTSAATTIYYLSTGTGTTASPNGIAFATPADLDGDHIADYVYAGDIQGNVWRFDLTSNNPLNWAVTPGPLFTSPGGQPITTAIVAASGAPAPGMQQQMMVLFGTGQKFPLTNLNPASYASGAQSLYGVWDWNLTGWNALSGIKYAALTAASAGLSGANNTVQTANLEAQTVTVNAATGDREILTNQQVCWMGSTLCASGNTEFGWTITLPGVNEQIIFSPELVSQALTVNSIVPAANDPTACVIPSDTGFTYVLSAMTGAAFNQVFLPPGAVAAGLSTNPAYADANAIGMQTNATGSSFITGNSSGTMYLVYETNQANGNSIQSGTLGLNLPPNTTGRRVSWVERR